MAAPPQEHAAETVLARAYHLVALSKFIALPSQLHNAPDADFGLLHGAEGWLLCRANVRMLPLVVSQGCWWQALT